MIINRFVYEYFDINKHKWFLSELKGFLLSKRVTKSLTKSIPGNNIKATILSAPPNNLVVKV